MKIDYSEQILTWEWDGCVIKIELPDIIHAEYHKDENMVMVYSGEKFINKIIFYYSLEGKLLGQQNLLEGTIDWNHNGKHQIIFNIYITFALLLTISVSSVFFAHQAILTNHQN